MGTTATSITIAVFLDLRLPNSNDIVSNKIYDKLDGFDFEIINSPFVDENVPRSTPLGVYMSRDMRFPTLWYTRPAKAQISLRVRAVWSEPLLVPLIFY